MRKYFYLLLGLILMLTLMLPSTALAEGKTKTIELMNPSPDYAYNTEWHFIITEIEEDQAPATILIHWIIGDSYITLDKFQYGVAHYYLDDVMPYGSYPKSGTAEIYNGWSGVFNLCEGPAPVSELPCIVPSGKSEEHSPSDDEEQPPSYDEEIPPSETEELPPSELPVVDPLINGLQTIYLSNPGPDYERGGEWHIIINQIDTAANIPASISITWSDGTTLPIDFVPGDFTGGVAHYWIPADYKPAAIYPVSGSAVIYIDWEGRFVLSHGPTPPVPELPVIALMGIGLMGAGTVLFIKRRTLFPKPG
jgi:hypothetical protein